MRYMGEPLPATPSPFSPPPAVRAQMFAFAPRMTDEDAEFYVEFAEATPHGGNRRKLHLGIAAAAGLLAGVALGKWVL